MDSLPARLLLAGARSFAAIPPLFLDGLQRLHSTGALQFFNDHCGLQDAKQFRTCLASLRKREWVVYAKRPFAGPEQVLAYLARYTHRVAISNSRLRSMDEGKVSFGWRDYRENGKRKTMALAAGEFIRRFLLHVLPRGFHRIRHYGLFANGHRIEKLELCRKLLGVTPDPDSGSVSAGEAITSTNEPPSCPCCGGRMRVIESFDGILSRPRGFDTS